MRLLDELRKSVLSGDYEKARRLMARLPGKVPGPEQAAQTRDALAWALQAVRIQRAQDAGRLAELTPAPPYGQRQPGARSTWTLKA